MSEIKIDILIGCVILLYCIRDIFKYKIPQIVFFSSTLFILCELLVGNDRLGSHIVSLVFFLPLSLIVIRNKINASLYAIFCIVIFLFIIITHESIESTITDVSRNYMSSYGLLCLFPLFLKGIKTSEDFVRLVICCVLGLSVAIAFVGRGGILSMGLLLFVVVFVNLLENKKNKKLKWVVLLSTLFIICIIAYIYNNAELGENLFPRFYQKGVGVDEDSDRNIMLAQYVLNQSWRDVIFGKLLSSCPLISFYNLNPHNSYIFTHSNYGILAILIVLVVCVKSCVITWRNGNYAFTVFILAFFFRAFTDTLMGPGILDVIVYSLIIMVWLNKKKVVISAQNNKKD